MNQVWVFVIGVVLGMLAVWIIMRNKQAGGSLDLIEKQAEQKAEHLQRIMQLLLNYDKITNEDVRKELGVSDATAVRYFDELEKQGKVRQVGKTGKYTFYSKNIIKLNKKHGVRF